MAPATHRFTRAPSGQRGRAQLRVVLAILALLGLACFERHMLNEQRAAVEKARRDVVAAEQRLVEARRQRDVTRQLLEQARHEMDEFSVSRSGDPAAAARNAEIRSWAERVRQLKTAFAEHPEARIPEMTMLTDADWLRIAKDASVGSEGEARSSMAQVRSAAKSTFAHVASVALLHAASDRATVTTTAELMAFFDPPIDSGILDRYVLTTTTAAKIPNLGGDNHLTAVCLQEKAPVDEIYDSRLYIEASGTLVQSNGPLTWENGLRERVASAFKAYSADPAHVGQPLIGLKDVLPYVQPPLDADTAARLLKAEGIGAR